jgi:hypothetical protein
VAAFDLGRKVMKNTWTGAESTGLSVFTHRKRKEVGTYEGRDYRPPVVAAEVAIGFVLGLATGALVVNAVMVLAGIQ